MITGLNLPVVKYGGVKISIRNSVGRFGLEGALAKIGCSWGLEPEITMVASGNNMAPE